MGGNKFDYMIKVDWEKFHLYEVMFNQCQRVPVGVTSRVAQPVNSKSRECQDLFFLNYISFGLCSIPKQNQLIHELVKNY